MSTQMVQYEGGGELANWRNPEQVLAEAQSAAAALGRVIAMKPKPVVFNGETYLEYEDWGTVAKFYGLTAKVLETRHVEYSGITGWEAVAVAIDKNGMEVSRAESMCMTDELNWGAVPIYEWKDELDEHGKKIWVEAKGGKKGYYKGQRVQVGTQPKPMFQLRSMAQTRACAKALRQVLSWVVVLGGFKPNVAEEMIESQLGPDGEPEPRPAVTQPTRASDKAKVTQQPAQTQQAQGGGQKPQVDGLETISGVMLSAKFNGKKTGMWIKVGEDLLVAEGERIHEEMAEGNYLSVKVKEHHHEKVGKYFKIIEVLKCESVQNGMVEEKMETQGGGLAAFEAENGTAAPAAEPESTLGDLFASGAVKKGTADLPAHDPAVIGIKRAQRLHVLITQQSKKTGFTEEQLTKVQAEIGKTLGIDLTHLRNLPVTMYETLEKYCTGEMTDWKTE